MPKVLITDNIHPQACDILQGVAEVVYQPKLSAAELTEAIAEMDGLMIRSASEVTESVLSAANKLKIVGRAGVGTDNIDLPAATRRGVIVVNSPEGNTVAAAEHTIGLIFSLARHIPEADRSLKQGQWKRKELTGVELFGKTLGLVGLGKIGSRVAKACLTLGMKVQVYDPFISESAAQQLGVSLVSLDDIWRASDFITFHVPKTRETLHLLNRNTLARCKRGVRIINCARGGLIDEQALYDELQSGHVAGVALDVFEQEPPPADHPLLTLGERVVVTPHLGASTEEAQVNVAIDVAEQLRDFFRDGVARSAVNIPLLRKEMLDPVRHYMPMAETLGRLVRQLAEGPPESLEVVAQGALAEHKPQPLTLAVLKGLLSTAREGVNYVNAPFLAEELGLRVQESTSKHSGNFTNRLTVTLKTGVRHYTVAATLIAGDRFQIVSVDDYPASLEPTPHILLTPHKDQPGMIAKVATVLGDRGINVSALQVGKRPGNGPGSDGASVMIFNLDCALPEEALSAMVAIEGIHGATYVRL
ncbi:MAG: phosphoglycerate dehydrogenase [Candidatus Melainabacteria bacterium]|nr:phosphoglycerate dehydrogenase [Candidatus Melainabacteria bacterium]